MKSQYKIQSKSHGNDSAKNIQQLKKIIRSIGIKVTGQRMTILEDIINGAEHVTAQEVFENVKQKDSAIGFATVYRFLRTLTDHKILSEVRMQGLPARYEWASKKHHDHISCTSCGKICEFENDEIENLQLQVAKRLGFQMTHHILELFGVCSDCLRAQKSNGKTTSAELSSGLRL